MPFVGIRHVNFLWSEPALELLLARSPTYRLDAGKTYCAKPFADLRRQRCREEF